MSGIYKVEVALSLLGRNELETLLSPGSWLSFNDDLPGRLCLLCTQEALTQLQWHDITSGERAVLAHIMLSPAQLAQYRAQLGGLPWEDEPPAQASH